jgi:hypothetical protein
MWAVNLGLALRGTASKAAPRALVSPWLVDEFVHSYVRWREEASTVRSAYERWKSADRQDRVLAFAAYGEALDREEHAALSYGGCHERFAGQTA